MQALVHQERGVEVVLAVDDRDGDLRRRRENVAELVDIADDGAVEAGGVQLGHDRHRLVGRQEHGDGWTDHQGSWRRRPSERPVTGGTRDRAR